MKKIIISVIVGLIPILMVSHVRAQVKEYGAQHRVIITHLDGIKTELVDIRYGEKKLLPVKKGGIIMIKFDDIAKIEITRRERDEQGYPFRVFGKVTLTSGQETEVEFLPPSSSISSDPEKKWSVGAKWKGKCDFGEWMTEGIYPYENIKEIMFIKQPAK